jgi:hypothetical protein
MRHDTKSEYLAAFFLHGLPPRRELLFSPAAKRDQLFVPVERSLPTLLNPIMNLRLVHQVANMIATATAITAVDNQPMAQSGRGRVNLPITRSCMAMIMITTISGTATTPFSTAAQNNALIGSISTKLIKMPTGSGNVGDTQRDVAREKAEAFAFKPR